MAIANNMKTKHTNGPWKVADKKIRTLTGGELIQVMKTEFKLTSQAHGPSVPRDVSSEIADVYLHTENAHANARLIAAAPELLTAVQQLVATLHNTYDVFEDLCKTGNMSANPLDSHVVQDIADQAADALEQATGVKP
jgi:hypothetical protein